MTVSVVTTKRTRSNNGNHRPSKSVIYKSEIRQAEDKVRDNLPWIVDNMLQLAKGGYTETRLEQEPAGSLYRDDYEDYEIMVHGVKQIRYKKIKTPMYPNLAPDQMVVTKMIETTFVPDRQACAYLINRILGVPKANADDELAIARTALAIQQIKTNIIQADFLEVQAEGKRIENELVPKQFVSEEEEREHIQTLLLALNRPLLHMTPEKAAEFGISPDQLEDLKGYLGVSQAAVIEEVFEGKAEDVLDEDEEGDDDTPSED